ncbi:MAG: hypothetical protein CM15mV10_0970 [uncultured marine virus]|nr:MAG: hypothetical protein CM15mV10_0970 [uncultured marine virus]
MITFETLKWKNFLSTGDQWIEMNLNTTTSTLIVGANGAGKSTMLDALTFALFNKPFRKISKGQLVNSINEKGTKVELTFTIGRDEYVYSEELNLLRSRFIGTISHLIRMLQLKTCRNTSNKAFSNSTSSPLHKSSSWVHPHLSPSCNSKHLTGEKLSKIYSTSRSSHK